MISVERIESGSSWGLRAGTLYIFAMALAILGPLGALLQREILGAVSGPELLERLQTSSGMMGAATAVLILQAAETCAVPVFAFLLTEKLKTAQGLPHFGSLLGAALLSEVPYDLTVTGELFRMDSQNPALGLVVAMLVLYFLKRYGGSILIGTAVTAAGLLWVNLLHIRHGSFLLILTVLLWALRDKPLARSLLGPVAGVLCSILSPFYLASPMGFLLVHFSNGEQEEAGPVRYFAYPAILLTLGLAGVLL